MRYLFQSKSSLMAVFTILVSQALFAQTNDKTEKIVSTVQKGVEIFKIITQKSPDTRGQDSTSEVAMPDTTPCKTYVIFTNNTELKLVVKLHTNKKTRDRWNNEVDETIDVTIAPGKSKKIRITEADSYKYKVYEDGGWTTKDHSQGIIEAEECKTVTEEID